MPTKGSTGNRLLEGPAEVLRKGRPASTRRDPAGTASRSFAQGVEDSTVRRPPGHAGVRGPPTHDRVASAWPTPPSPWPKYDPRSLERGEGERYCGSSAVRRRPWAAGSRRRSPL